MTQINVTLHADEVAEVRGCAREQLCTSAADAVKTNTFGDSLRQFLNRQGETITPFAAAEIGGWVILADAFYLKEMQLAYSK